MANRATLVIFVSYTNSFTIALWNDFQIDDNLQDNSKEKWSFFLNFLGNASSLCLPSLLQNIIIIQIIVQSS